MFRQFFLSGVNSGTAKINAKFDLVRLGIRVRVLRHEKGWTLNDLAERSRTSRTFICKLEHAKAKILDIQALATIADALDVSIDDLAKPEFVTLQSIGKTSIDH